MEAKYTYKKNYQLLAIIAGIGLIFSSITIIKAFNESKVYGVSPSDIPINTTSRLGQEMIKIQNTVEANEAVNHQDYEKALKSISGTRSEDYYNRGTIQTLIAYQNALESSISGLENAQIFLAQAQQNFTIAKKLSRSSTITDAISQNEKTIVPLSTVIDIKTCYSIGQTIITSMKNIHILIQNIQETLDQEEVYISKRASSLDAACYDKLRYILDTSREQVGALEGQMNKNTKQYISDLSDKVIDPMICIQTPYENIIPSITKGRQGLQQYQFQHQATIEALKSNDKKSIEELCNPSKNDAQINQQIESAVQELLGKLEDNTTENQEKQRSSNEVQYKDFFNEDEKEALQEIQKVNQGRIENMLEVRGKGNYDANTYIDDMFNDFYGNSGDFIDLHK